MSTASFIQRCVESGMPLEMAVKAAGAFEAEADAMVAAALEQLTEREAAKRARNAERMRDVRERASTNTHVHAQNAPLPPKDTQPLSEPTSLDQNPNPPPYKPPALVDGFAEFWLAYPEKVGKRVAEASWRRAVARAEPTAILAGLERAKLCRKWREGFIPNPATWLNQDRWADEPDETARGPPMTGGMVAAASDEIAFRIATGQIAQNGTSDGNPFGNQGVVSALPAPSAGGR